MSIGNHEYFVLSCCVQMGDTIDTIVAIADVMREAALVEEMGRSEQQEQIVQLQTENETLRELLRISSAAGSAPRQTRATQTSTDAVSKPHEGNAVNGTVADGDSGENSDVDDSSQRRLSQESIDLDDEDDVLFQTMRPIKKSNEPLFAQRVADSVNRSADTLKSSPDRPVASGNPPILSNGSVATTTEH